MIRRGAVLAVLGAAALVVAACQPPPPPDWVRPEVAAVVSPDPVVAGQPFTIEVTATSNTPVITTGILLYRPAGAPRASTPYPDAGCIPGDLVAGTTEAQTHTGTRTYTCTLPTIAPNGEWRVRASAINEGSGGYQGSVDLRFQVTGGSDDLAPPVLDSVEISPDPVVIGQPFSVTLRAFDEHHVDPAPAKLGANIVLPAPPEGSVNWSCPAVTPAPISNTVLEWRFTDCLIPEGSSPWTYAGGVQVADQLGNSARVSFSFSAVTG